MIRKILFLLVVMYSMGACNAPSSDNFTAKLLASYHATVLADAQDTQKEIEGYLRVLRSIAEDPPINDEVSDSIAYAIAVAVYKDKRLTGLRAGFYFGLMRVENPQLEPYVENWYGAVGLTQVVPEFWEGKFSECGENLRTNIYTQVCYGARVYLTYMDIWGDEVMALYAYNGCTEAHRQRQARCMNFPTWVQNYAQTYEELLYD